MKQKGGGDFTSYCSLCGMPPYNLHDWYEYLNNSNYNKYKRINTSWLDKVIGIKKNK